MKKVLFILMLLISQMTYSITNESVRDSLIKNDSIHKEYFEIDSLPSKVIDFYKSDSLIHKLIFAMIDVESRGNDKISNKKGDCIGCLQITKTLIKDANRILKSWGVNKTYKYVDRTNRNKSVEIFLIINTYYNKNASWEKIAKSWNQGIGGMYKYKKKAAAYWKLVKKKL